MRHASEPHEVSRKRRWGARDHRNAFADACRRVDHPERHPAWRGITPDPARGVQKFLCGHRLLVADVINAMHAGFEDRRFGRPQKVRRRQQMKAASALARHRGGAASPAIEPPRPSGCRARTSAPSRSTTGVVECSSCARTTDRSSSSRVCGMDRDRACDRDGLSPAARRTWVLRREGTTRGSSGRLWRRPRLSRDWKTIACWSRAGISPAAAQRAVPRNAR